MAWNVNLRLFLRVRGVAMEGFENKTDMKVLCFSKVRMEIFIENVSSVGG